MSGLDHILALLIEDDRRLSLLTQEYLTQHEVTVLTAYDGPSGLSLAVSRPFDVILLDLMLPGMDGITVCQRIRAVKDVPILMLTARGEEADRVMGLELGADDYLPKPFSPRELLARIRAAVRRARGGLTSSVPSTRNSERRIGRLVLDPSNRTAKLDGRLLELTSYEFSLLFALAESRGRILSREQLMELAQKNPEDSFDRSVDVHISHLRQKLGDDPKHPRMIKTVRGVGYLFSDEVD
jgi:two-component system response regulator RstA